MNPSPQFIQAMHEARRLRHQLDGRRGYVAGKITRPSWDLLRAPLPQVQARFRA